MNGLFTAFAFLTIVKIDQKKPDPVNAPFFFPIVGLIIGIPAIFLLKIPNIGALFTLLYFVVITGALHIDGLSDTADGIFSHRPKEKKLEIMKDSRVGVMGVLAIIILLLTKYESFKNISSLSVFLVPGYGRLMAVLIMKKLLYVRETGTGGYFKNLNGSEYLNYILFLPVILTIFLGIKKFILVGVLFFILYKTIVYVYQKIIGGWTGDMLGAAIEITEGALFLLWIAF